MDGDYPGDLVRVVYVCDGGLRPSFDPSVCTVIGVDRRLPFLRAMNVGLAVTHSEFFVPLPLGTVVYPGAMELVVAELDDQIADLATADWSVRRTARCDDIAPAPIDVIEVPPASDAPHEQRPGQRMGSGAGSSNFVGPSAVFRSATARDTGWFRHSFDDGTDVGFRGLDAHVLSLVFFQHRLAQVPFVIGSHFVTDDAVARSSTGDIGEEPFRRLRNDLEAGAVR